MVRRRGTMKQLMTLVMVGLLASGSVFAASEDEGKALAGYAAWASDNAGLVHTLGELRGPDYGYALQAMGYGPSSKFIASLSRSGETHYWRTGMIFAALLLFYFKGRAIARGAYEVVSNINYGKSEPEECPPCPPCEG